METVKIKVDGEEKDFVIKLDDEELYDDMALLDTNDNNNLEDTLDLTNDLEKTMEIDTNE